MAGPASELPHLLSQAWQLDFADRDHCRAMSAQPADPLRARRSTARIRTHRG